MNTVKSTFENPESLVSVTLHKSYFAEESSYVKVTRNTVTLDNLIAGIIDENRGIDPYMVQHAAVLLQQQIIKMIRNGNAVNILDLGTLYIAVKGSVKGNSPTASDLPDFKVKFTPSSLVNDAISNITVDKIVIADTAPQINLIKDDWTKTENSILTKGKTCLIEGSRLKLGGNEYSLSFIMVDNDGNEVEGQPPVVIAEDKLISNTQQKLHFYIPEDLVSDATYKIRISTSYLAKNSSRKTPVVAESEPVKIVE